MEQLSNNEFKKKVAIVLCFLVLMICITGSTYAYFAITASNNDVTGKVGSGSSLSLTVTKLFPTNDSNMIPQLESSLDKAISEDYSCVDENGHLVCQVYSATVKNLNEEDVVLNGTISFTGIENMPNLKWKRIDDERTIGEYSSYTASTNEAIFESNKTFTPDEEATYYFVIWIDEIGEAQYDEGVFRANINFKSDTGNLSSSVKPESSITYPILATDLVSTLYNDGSSINTVNIGGDTSKPEVSLNNVQRIMLDNNGEYRYYGNETTEDTANGKYLTKNYVSFNGELWRIVSSSKVFSSESDTTGSQRLRIIRAESIGYHAWDVDTDGDGTDTDTNNWETATLNTTLNGIYYNGTSGTCYIADAAWNPGTATTCDYSENGTIKGLSEEARSLIDDAVWYLGGNNTSDLYADDYYTFERGTTVSTEGYPTSTVAKLGIMYPSDYAYAADLSVCIKTGLNYETDTTNCTGTDWLFNNDYQWLISPNSSDSSYAFDVESYGCVSDMDVDRVSFAVGGRPVAVLKPNVMITGGTGTSGDPYTLSLG